MDALGPRNPAVSLLPLGAFLVKQYAKKIKYELGWTAEASTTETGLY